MVKFILISVICGGVASLLRATRVGERDLEVFSKSLSSVAFVILGAIAWRSGDPVATWLVIGLVLCAIGDVLLIWENSFDLGLVSFLLGHVAYVVSFHTATPVTDWTPWTLVPIAAVSTGALAWLWPHLGRRRISVSAYVVVITIMVWGALAVTSAGVMGWTIAAGAVLFYLSDLTVARDRFVKPDFVNRAIGLPMYYTAQILIALSI